MLRLYGLGRVSKSVDQADRLSVNDPSQNGLSNANRCDDDLRVQAVGLLRTSGQLLAQIARELDVVLTLRAWKRRLVGGTLNTRIPSRRRSRLFSRRFDGCVGKMQFERQCEVSKELHLYWPRIPVRPRGNGAHASGYFGRP